MEKLRPPTPDPVEKTPVPLRYTRQTALPEFGEQGQARLAAGRVLIVGVGGLGSPAAMYLAAAGVGTLGLVDFDAVDETNLHRQIIYGTPDVGRPKLAAAAERLQAINPHVRRSSCTRNRSPPPTRARSSSSTTSSLTAPTTSRRDTWSTTRA